MKIYLKETNSIDKSLACQVKSFWTAVLFDQAINVILCQARIVP